MGSSKVLARLLGPKSRSVSDLTSLESAGMGECLRRLQSDRARVWAFVTTSSQRYPVLESWDSNSQEGGAFGPRRVAGSALPLSGDPESGGTHRRSVDGCPSEGERVRDEWEVRSPSRGDQARFNSAGGGRRTRRNAFDVYPWPRVRYDRCCILTSVFSAICASARLSLY